MEYRIERAKTGRSMCRHCGMTIEAGVWRFGGTGKISRWFHLGCGAEGAPRAFKPFREQAEALLVEEPDQKAAAPAPRDLQAEAVLAADPTNPEARQVFMDSLLAAGDPWGDILALHLAGKTKKANKLFKTHEGDLTGGLAAKNFEWQHGFMETAFVESRSKKMLAELLERLFSLRTACTMNALRVPTPPNGAMIAMVNEKAPASLRSVFFHYGPALGGLVKPELEELRLFVLADPVSDRDFLSGEGLPALTSLSLYSNTNPLPAPFLRDLIRSPLVAGLERLRLVQGALDDAGTSVLLEEAEQLDHLVKLVAETPNPRKGEMAKRFKTWCEY